MKNYDQIDFNSDEGYLYAAPQSDHYYGDQRFLRFQDGDTSLGPGSFQSRLA